MNGEPNVPAHQESLALMNLDRMLEAEECLAFGIGAIGAAYVPKKDPLTLDEKLQMTGRDPLLIHRNVALRIPPEEGTWRGNSGQLDRLSGHGDTYD